MNDNHNHDGALSVTSAEEWKRKHAEGVKVTLPTSGYTVRLRPIGLTDLMFGGVIPDELSAILSVLDEKGDRWLEEEKDQLLSRSGDAGKVFDAIAMAVMLEPRVVERDPSEGEIALEMLPADDKVFIYNLAQQDALRLQFFRAERAGAMAAGDVGGAVQPAAEPSSGDT